MSERDSLIQAMRAYPADSNLRLVFADWLNEHGEEELEAVMRSSRGEFCVMLYANSPEGTDFDSSVQESLNILEFLCTSNGRLQTEVRKVLKAVKTTLRQLQLRREAAGLDASPESPDT